MSTAHVEIETKYDVAEDAVLPALDDVKGVSASTPPVEHDLEAAYFDTEDLALVAARITVRRRTGGDDEGWHVKLPLEQGRQELHFPLGSATRSVPRAVRSVLTGVVRGRPLVLVATLRTRRTVHGLLDETGVRLAEVCDDRVTVTRPGAEAEPVRWREWEVELVEGRRSVLDRVDRLLRRHGAAPAASASKLGRALDIPPREPSSTRRPSSAEALVADRLTGLVETLTALDPMVRADLPHSIHSMRVGVRRLAGALATYRPLLDRRVSDPLRLELKWLAGVLGEARDAEVLLERLADALADERTPLRRQVEQTVREDRRTAHLAAVSAMEGERYLALLDRLTEIGVEPPWALGRPARTRATKVLVARVDHEWARVAERMAVAESSADEDRAEALHDARRAAKRLRYAVEPMVAVVGKPARRTLAAALELHTVLGEHHDSVVARQRLAQLAADLTPVDAFQLGLQSARQHDEADRAEAEVGRIWGRLRKRRPRRWQA